MSHLVIESPYSYSSRTTFTITDIANGKPHTAHGVIPRDSAFRWRPGGSIGGTSLGEFQSTPQKDVILRTARSMVQNPEELDLVDQIIAELVKSDDGAFLNYMKGATTEGQYVNALQSSYRRMAKDLRTVIGEERSTRFLSVVLNSPYYSARDIRRDQLGLPP